MKNEITIGKPKAAGIIESDYYTDKMIRMKEHNEMELRINPGGTWYHGSDRVFSELKEGSTVTQWKELAEAFSHKPTRLSYDDNGVISHNGKEKGYLYILDEPVTVGIDVVQHPRTVMDKNAEFLTKRPLRVKLICELQDKR